MKMNKVAVIAGALLVAGAAAMMVIAFDAGDSPIEVGDGSITFQSDGAQKNDQNDKEVSVNKLLRKVKMIDIRVYDTSVILQSIDVRGRDWTLSSVSSQVQVSRHTVVPLLQDSVTATCTVTWSGSGSVYTCATTDGSQLTPASLTFSDGNCPSGATPTCTLTCPDGKKCVITLHNKVPLASAGSAEKKTIQ
jgi:hypothetical protein